MRYTPGIFLLIIINCSILLSAGIIRAQSSDDIAIPVQKKINKVSQNGSSDYVVNVLTGTVWKSSKAQEEDFIENIEQGQGWLNFKGGYGGIISKDINQIDIKVNRYINFSFVNLDFENIKERDLEANIYSIYTILINTDGSEIVKKYIEFPNDIKEKTVSIDLREFSHFIDTNTIVNKFIFSNPAYPGNWGFNGITITGKPTGVLLMYDGYGFAPEERGGTSMMPQSYTARKANKQIINLIKEGVIYPREGTVYDDNGGIFSLFGYDVLATNGWVDIIIPDEFVIDLTEKPIMSLEIKTEADIFSFNIMARNTDGYLIIGGNSDDETYLEVRNTEMEWENYQIDLGERISNKTSNTKIKSIRLTDLEVNNKSAKNTNYFEIELTDLHFIKAE